MELSSPGIWYTKKGRRYSVTIKYPDDDIKLYHVWLQKSQQRHKLLAIRIHGESGLGDMKSLYEALPELKTVIAEYYPRDVYNMDDIAKFVSSFG